MARPVALAFGWHDLSPLSWLGSAVGRVAADGWTAAMTGLWSASLWLLQLVFGLIDAFTTPDLSAQGPLGAVLPTTLWLAAGVAAITLFLQIGAALVRRDGQSIGRVLLGIVQFGLVWAAYITVAAAVVVAAGGLAKGLLHSLLGIDSFAQFSIAASWPRKVDDAVVATVLGVVALFLLLPGCFFHLVIMLVRAAGLILLAATSPISAAGLLADATKTWFWKTLRWFIACALILPLAALVLGIGVKLTAGVVSGAGDATAAAVGTAVVGAMLVAISSVCPLVLFRLLAFVEPGTASGAALRQSWADAGGMSGLLTGMAGAGTGSSSAASSVADGRSAGESAAESQTGSRFAAALGVFGQGMQTAARVGAKAADVGSDVLGQAGVGHPGYAMGFADEALMRRRSTGPDGGSRPGRGGGDGSGQDTGPRTPGGGGHHPPLPDPLPVPASPPTGPAGGPGLTPAGAGGLEGGGAGPAGGGGGGGAAGAAGAAGVAAL